MLGVDENSDPELHVGTLAKFEDVFVQRKSQIRRSLEQITAEPLNSDQSEIVRELNISFSGVGESDDEFEEAVITFIRMIITRTDFARSVRQDSQEF